MTKTLIQSRENPRFRLLLDLVNSSRERRKRHQTFIEGIHLCQAFGAQGGVPVQVISTEAGMSHAEVRPLLLADAAELTVLTPALFRELSQVKNGVALAYVITTPSQVLPERISAPESIAWKKGFQRSRSVLIT